MREGNRAREVELGLGEGLNRRARGKGEDDKVSDAGPGAPGLEARRLGGGNWLSELSPQPRQGDLRNEYCNAAACVTQYTPHSSTPRKSLRNCALVWASHTPSGQPTSGILPALTSSEIFCPLRLHLRRVPEIEPVSKFHHMGTVTGCEIRLDSASRNQWSRLAPSFFSDSSQRSLKSALPLFQRSVPQLPRSPRWGWAAPEFPRSWTGPRAMMTLKSPPWI